MPRAKVRRPQKSAELLNRREAGAYLGVSPQTLAIWQVTGRYELPVVKVGRLVRYRLADLDLFLSSRTQSNKVEAGSDHSKRERSFLEAPPLKAEHEQANPKVVEFAQVRMVDQQTSKNPEQRATDLPAGLEIVLPSGIKLRLSPGCSLDLLSSVVTMLENS